MRYFHGRGVSQKSRHLVEIKLPTRAVKLFGKLPKRTGWQACAPQSSPSLLVRQTGSLASCCFIRVYSRHSRATVYLRVEDNAFHLEQRLSAFPPARERQAVSQNCPEAAAFRRPGRNQPR